MTPQDLSLEAAGETGSAPINHDKFLIRPKILRLGETYALLTESGDPLLFVERLNLWRKRFVVLSGVLLATLAAAGALFTVLSLHPSVDDRPLRLLWILGAPFAAWFVTLIVSIKLLEPRRPICCYADPSKESLVLEVTEDGGRDWGASFTVRLPSGAPVGRLRLDKRPHMLSLPDYSLREWTCSSPDGQRLWSIRSSLPAGHFKKGRRSYRRSLLPLGYEFFVGNRVAGRFTAFPTPVTECLLDLSADPERTVDRRLAVAAALLLRAVDLP